MAGIHRALRAGIAELLDKEGAVTWDASGTQLGSPTPPPMFDSRLPDKPDVAAAIATYAAGGDDPTQPISRVQVQIKTRSSLQDTAAGDDLDDNIADVLLGNFPIDLPNDVRILVIRRNSSTPIGSDAVGREERTTNYDVVVHDPTTHRQ